MALFALVRTLGLLYYPTISNYVKHIPKDRSE